MTMEEVIENELKCVQRDCCRLENECAKCDLVLPIEEIINAYNEALRLKKENLYYKDIVEINSAKWEEQGQRVVALEQENAELKAVNRMALYSKMSDRLAKAEELLLELYDCIPSSMADSCKETLQKVALFFKDSEVAK